jgi:peroxiredoxin
MAWSADAQTNDLGRRLDTTLKGARDLVECGSESGGGDRPNEPEASPQDPAPTAQGRTSSQTRQAEEPDAKTQQPSEPNRTETGLSRSVEPSGLLGRNEDLEKNPPETNARPPESTKSRYVNRPARDFQLKAVDGHKYALSDLKGKVVLINFWATWCAPCVGELPHLARIYEQYKERGFELLAISIDDPAKHYLVKKLAQKYRLNFPVLYDKGAAKLYDVAGYPTSLFVDRDGDMRYFQEGALEDGVHRLEIILNELLKRSSP